MDIKDVLDNLTEDEIISFMENLGAEISDRSNAKDLIFTTVCHSSDSFKLYYSKEFRTFKCYSNCGVIGNLIDLLIHIKKYKAKDAISEIKEFFNIGNTPKLKKGFRHKKRYKKQTIDDVILEPLPIPEYKPYIYTTFKSTRIQTWEKEFISYDTLKKFEIRYDFTRQQIIVPHFCPFEDKRPIGIRVREMNDYKIEKYGKYHPLYYEEHQYAHRLGNNLYGLNFNKDNIKKYKKCIIFEGEKGVLQLEGMFKDNIGVALCGSNMSLYQTKLLLELDIEKCIFALDKQYKTEEEKELWKIKVFKLASKLVQNGVECYMLLDEIEGLLEYKDAPTDKDKEIFMKLIQNKIKIGEIE